MGSCKCRIFGLVVQLPFWANKWWWWWWWYFSFRAESTLRRQSVRSEIESGGRWRRLVAFDWFSATGRECSIQSTASGFAWRLIFDTVDALTRRRMTAAAKESAPIRIMDASFPGTFVPGTNVWTKLPSNFRALERTECRKRVTICNKLKTTWPILSAFFALIVHFKLNSVHPGFAVAFIF